MIRLCIILGAMKAGTTSLFAYLAQHPEIAPCREKEPDFFSHHFKKGPDWYFSLWKGADRERQVWLEASTSYTKYPSFPDASSNLAQFATAHGIAPKFIYVMRDPIARIESQHTYGSARWNVRSLEEGLGPKSHLVNVSRYAQQLDQYAEAFDRGDLLLIDFDDLTRRPSDVLVTICAFLGIDPDYPFEDTGRLHNVSTGARIVRPLETLCERYPGLRRAGRMLPTGLRHAIRNTVFRKRVEEKLKLTEAQEQAVRGLLGDDMARLRSRYGVDVGKWGF